MMDLRWLDRRKLFGDVLLCLLFSWLLAGCASQIVVPPPRSFDPGEGAAVFVVSNGWHSSIVIARSDVPPGRIPESVDFPHAHYLEFGWGDAEYYPAERHTIAMTLRAALLPTPSVVHIVGLSEEPEKIYERSEVIELKMSAKALHQLTDFIVATIERDGALRASTLGPGLYADSKFYPAVGLFHLNNTCNTWSARALAAAGFPIRPDKVSRAEELMRYVRAFAVAGD